MPFKGLKGAWYGDSLEDRIKYSNHCAESNKTVRELFLKITGHEISKYSMYNLRSSDSVF